MRLVTREGVEKRFAFGLSQILAHGHDDHNLRVRERGVRPSVTGRFAREPVLKPIVQQALDEYKRSFRIIRHLIEIKVGASNIEAP